MKSALQPHATYPREEYEEMLADELDEKRTLAEKRGPSLAPFFMTTFFLAVLFATMAVGAIYALKFGGWV